MIQLTIPASWHVDWFVWGLLSVVTVLGLLAIFSPRLFSIIARRGGEWVDTNKLVEKLDKQIHIDHHMIRHSRVFGITVVAASVFLGYVFYSRVLGHPPLF